MAKNFKGPAGTDGKPARLISVKQVLKISTSTKLAAANSLLWTGLCDCKTVSLQFGVLFDCRLCMQVGLINWIMQLLVVTAAQVPAAECWRSPAFYLPATPHHCYTVCKMFHILPAPPPAIRSCFHLFIMFSVSCMAGAVNMFINILFSHFFFFHIPAKNMCSW